MSIDQDYQYSLGKVLTRSFHTGKPPVVIPPYQRPYRWSISEVRKLLEDLDSFRYNPETKSYDESAQYYYGTICFHAHDGKLELIDGQQRLTSFLILIKALLDVTDGINKVKHLRDELIETIKTLSSDQDWHENQWQPQYEYRQPQTQEHIAAIYREQFADYLRVRKLIQEATQLAGAEQDSNNEGQSDVPDYVIQFFTDEFKRLKYALTNGDIAVRIIESRYEAELFFQCENNRGKEMELIDMLKAYHLRIALSVENSETKRKETLKEIKGIWEKLTGDGARYRRFKTTVISLLLIRWGVAYWMHWDKTNVEKLKGIHGTYRGNLVVDEKLAQTGKGAGEKGKFLPDLMTPVKPGLPFFQTLEYYQRIVEALYSTVRLSKGPEDNPDENVGANVCNMFHDMVLAHKPFFDNSHEIAVQAAVCWLDRFATVAPDLERPFENDVDRLRDAYNKDMDFLVYVQCYIRLFKRLRVPLKRNDKEQILLFGQLQGARQIAFFKLDRPTENLITIPYRTNSPAECRRELERLTHPDEVTWAMVGDRRQRYREYVDEETRVETIAFKEQAQ